MKNPKLSIINMNGNCYGFMWQDFNTFKKINIYKNEKYFGYLNLPIPVDEGVNVVKYLIKRLELNGIN